MGGRNLGRRVSLAVPGHLPIQGLTPGSVRSVRHQLQRCAGARGNAHACMPAEPLGATEQRHVASREG